MFMAMTTIIRTRDCVPGDESITVPWEIHLRDGKAFALHVTEPDLEYESLAALERAYTIDTTGCERVELEA